jgi:hypothetical protein
MKSVAVLTALLSVCALARATVTETFKHTYPLAPNGVVHLENVNGPVEITAWDKPEVSLEAEKSAPDDDYLKRIHLVIDASPDRLSIKTEYEKKNSFFGDTRGEVHYKLMVPAGVTLKNIDVVNSDLTVQGVKGPADLHTVNGRLEATGLASAGRFATVNGSIAIQFDSLATKDDISVETVNGSCRVTVPRNSGFELRASSVNGSISCDLPITLEKSGHHHLRGTVGAGGPKLSLESVNGSLSVLSH